MWFYKLLRLIFSYAVITVMPALTALTVQEPDQIAVIQITVAPFMGGAVPFTLTYMPTDGTAEGM